MCLITCIAMQNFLSYLLAVKEIKSCLVDHFWSLPVSDICLFAIHCETTRICWLKFFLIIRMAVVHSYSSQIFGVADAVDFFPLNSIN